MSRISVYEKDPEAEDAGGSPDERQPRQPWTQWTPRSLRALYNENNFTPDATDRQLPSQRWKPWTPRRLYGSILTPRTQAQYDTPRAMRVVKGMLSATPRIMEAVASPIKNLSASGFFDITNLCDFNQELLKPCCRATGSRRREEAGETRPYHEFEFIRCNTACFWLGIADLVIMRVVSKQTPDLWVICIAILDGQLGYFFSYL